MRVGMFGALIVFLTACHADVTFRFDFHSDGSALATTSEILDDQLYKLAESQDTSGDPFGTEQLQRAGWAVLRSSDNVGNHIITATKLLSRSDLKNVATAVPALRGPILPFSSIGVSRSAGLFTEDESLSATIDPLLPFAQAAINRPYMGFASVFASSAVAVHLELRTPGKVLATNGEMAPKGFARWDVGLQAPTTVRYTVRFIRYDRVAVLAVIALIALLFTFRWIGAQLRRPLSRRGGSERA
jgi:hypothetical protein